MGTSLEEFYRPECENQVGSKTLLQQAIKGIATHVFYDQMNHINMTNFFIGHRETSMIDKTLMYVEQHLLESIDIDAVSGFVSTSRTNLNLIFRKNIQLQPTRAVIRLKMEKSLKLMKDGLSVKEIALAPGYSSTFHSSRMFLFIMGRRPSK